jgi:hypothetical protein
MALISSLQIFTQAYIMSEAANGNGNVSDGNPARSTLFYTIYLFSWPSMTCAWATPAPWPTCSSS